MAIREARSVAASPRERMVAREPVTATEDLITALFGAGLIGGAMSDAWAHINVLSDIQGEGFFTPWHGLLYGSFTGLAAWLFWLAYRRRERAPRWWVDGWPAGYGLSAVAIAIFAFAGACDMLWHEVFGVEVNLDGVLSPSHLLLGVGAVLLLTGPLRSWWRVGGGGRRAFAGVLTLGLSTALAATFLLYVSPLEMAGPARPFDGRPGSEGYTEASLGLASYLITTLVFVLPLLLAHQRRPAFGVATSLVGSATCFVLVTNEFPQPQTAGGLAAVAAALLVDWIIVKLDTRRGPDASLRLPIIAGSFAVLVWSAHLLALHLTSGITWSVEMWTGVLAVSAAMSALLGWLATGVRRPA